MSDPEELLLPFGGTFTDLRSWWEVTSKAELEIVEPKAVEYGATDLLTIGTGLIPADQDRGRRIQAGIAFYALGKCARLTSALQVSSEPSVDTWVDLSIYARMGHYARVNRSWP